MIVFAINRKLHSTGKFSARFNSKHQHETTEGLYASKHESSRNLCVRLQQLCFFPVMVLLPWLQVNTRHRSFYKCSWINDDVCEKDKNSVDTCVGSPPNGSVSHRQCKASDKKMLSDRLRNRFLRNSKDLNWWTERVQQGSNWHLMRSCNDISQFVSFLLCASSATIHRLNMKHSASCMFHPSVLSRFIYSSSHSIQPDIRVSLFNRWFHTNLWNYLFVQVSNRLVFCVRLQCFRFF